MSPELQEWFAAAKDSFEDALREDDCELAFDILEDMKEKGIDTKQLEEDYKIACIEVDYSE